MSARSEAECGRKRPAWTANLTCAECVGDVLKDLARREPDARCDTEGRVFEQEHCGQKPVADECIATLDLLGCWGANDTAGCMKCVQELDGELKRLRCTPREEAAYCGGPEPVPGAVSQPCKNDLIKACEPFGGNHGTVRECDKCTVAANVTVCTKQEELSFCLPAPPFKPSETSCELHLMRACEMDQKNPKACVACVKKAVEPPGSTNCSHREEEVFCAPHDHTSVPTSHSLRRSLQEAEQEPEPEYQQPESQEQGQEDEPEPEQVEQPEPEYQEPESIEQGEEPEPEQEEQPEPEYQEPEPLEQEEQPEPEYQHDEVRRMRRS